MKFHFPWIAIHVTDNSNININIKTKIRTYLKGALWGLRQFLASKTL